MALVFLHRQNVVGVSCHDLLRDRPLAAHGVDGHHSPAQFQRGEQLGNGGDLVGFVVHLALRQHQVVGAGPGRNHMHQRLLACFARAAQGLAVDGHHLAGRQPGDGNHPLRKALSISAGSSAEITRLNVSCEGMPPGNFRKPLNHGRLALP